MTCTIEPFSIEAAYPAPVRRFLHSLGMSRKRNSMSGLIFNGPQLNKLTRERSFSLLEREFATESDAAQDLLRHCLQHLRSLRNLYDVCTRKKLSDNYVSIIEDFRSTFDCLYRRGFLYETPKIHMLYARCHLQQLLEDSQETLWLSNTQVSPRSPL